MLVVGADLDLIGLIEQWLPAERYAVTAVAVGAAVVPQDPDLVIVDLPSPARAHLDSLRSTLSTRTHVPILALSPAVFASVECCGAAARALGADGLLPKPTNGDAMRRAVDHLSGC